MARGCDLGLGQYEQAFRENDIDGDVLADLTADDLSGLGVVSIGHRRKLLAAIAAVRAGSPPAMPSPEAERRQLSVMFVDLVGSTALAAPLDPEDMREVIGTYHRRIAETVGRFGGFVAKYMGDGVLVYFGWPQADEADAERAVRAALATLEAVGQIAPADERLSARVGIASGLAVVGDLLGAGAAQEQAVIGETPNVAARLLPAPSLRTGDDDADSHDGDRPLCGKSWAATRLRCRNSNISKTLRDWGGVWTYEDLNTFLYGPVLTIPGVRMETPGISDETERFNLIAYLRTLSDKPIPLP